MAGLSEAPRHHSGQLSPSSPSATALTSPNLSRVSPTNPIASPVNTRQRIPKHPLRYDPIRCHRPTAAPVRLTPPTTSVLRRAVITGGGWPHVVKVEHEEADRVQAVRGLQHAGEYRKIKRPFPPTASAHPMPLCSRCCPRLASARTPRAAHPGEHPTRACPRRPAPPGTTPHRRARTGRVAGAAWRGVAGWNLHGQLRVSSCALSICVVRAAGGDPASAAAPAAGGTRPYPAHRPSAWQPSCRMSVCHCATQSCSSMGSNRRKPTWKRFQKLVCGSVRYTTSVLFSCATHSISPSASSRNR
jgi:hypothetical protein